MTCTHLHGQFHNCDFRSPVNQTIISSGSYGEPRSAHFHAGIDVKPRIGEGRDSIFSIGDGYISRVKMAPDGYGLALYIDHPCGYTSVYAHLYRYAKSIEEYADKVRVATKKSQIDQYPPANALKIKKGEFIGMMGNSGNSFGAHLHFEIRGTKTETPINPVLFGIGPKDRIAPVIKALIVYQLDNRKKVISQSYYPTRKTRNGVFTLGNSPLETSWPLIGFGIQVYDQSNGASNHNGIHKLSYYVNGEKRFSFSIDSIPFDVSQYLHAHMDYHFKKQNQYVHKCYQDEDNLLNIYRSSNASAVLIPNQVIADQITLRASDIFGNESILNFRLRGNMRIGHHKIDSSYNVPKDIDSHLKKGKFSVYFPAHTFLHSENITLNDSSNSIEIKTQQTHVPLFKKYHISTDLTSEKLSNPIFIKTNRKGQKVNYGGVNKEGSLSLRTNELGKYQMVDDITPPTINVVNVNRYTNVTFTVTDNYKTKGASTRLEYDAYVDDKWVPVEYDEKNNLMRIERKWIINGKNLIIKVADYSKNQSEKTILIK